MKKLSVEEKAKAYDEAVKKFRSLHDDYDTVSTLIDIKKELEEILPELKEPKDERIRKELIEQVVYIVPNNDEVDSEGNVLPTYQKRIDKYLAWLEKQGEQKPAEKYNIDGIDSKNAQGKLGEMIKNLKPADKVEPKFKIGDWLINRHGNIRQVIDIKDGLYYCIRLECCDTKDTPWSGAFEYVDGNWRKWTIADAKDGDVLCTKNKCCPFIYDKGRYNNGLAYYYAGIDVGGNLNIKSPHNMLAHFGRLDNIRPATKEQRNLLFKKMHEAGFEWDAENKQLKKIEPKKELTEFENRLCEIVDAAMQNPADNPNTIIFDVKKKLAPELLELAQKQFQQEFDKQLEQAYKNADEVQYKRGYRKAIDDTCKGLLIGFPEDIREYMIDSYTKDMEQKLKELSQG